jgi:hypothetical protein
MTPLMQDEVWMLCILGVLWVTFFVLACYSDWKDRNAPK